MIAGPALVVADEPTARLDVTTSAEMVALLREVANEDTAILVVGHDLPLLRTLSARGAALGLPVKVPVPR